MSASLLDRLLGLERLSLDGSAMQWSWERPLPAVAWGAAVMLALAWSGWSYYHLQGPRWARSLLGLMRWALLVLMVVLTAGPMLVVPRERVEGDVVAVLVDRSASMRLRDHRLPEGEVVTRDEAVRRALAVHRDAFETEEAGGERRVLWLGFDADVAPLPESDPMQWGAPVGESTRLGHAIAQALRLTIGRPISAVVVISDGRSVDGLTADMEQRLQRQAASVFSVPVGSEQAPADYAIGRVDAPDRAFVGEPAPVRVWVERQGEGQDALTLRLIDEASGEVIDEQPAAVGDEPIRLTARATVPGPSPWRIDLIADTAAPELIIENNTRPIFIEFIDRPIRVLYVEGYPRWEYRYLTNLMMREASIASSVLLTSADLAFVQEGDIPLTRLPQDAKEVEPFDVIVLGDVPPSALSADAVSLLRDQVAIRGAGLVWIAGPRHTPTAYEGTSLGDLLPMKRPGQVTRLDPGAGVWSMRATPLAGSLGLMQFDEAQAIEALPPLRWVQDVGELKPSVEVLAQGVSPLSPEREPLTLASRMRYGAGQVVYVATDETWRWRLGRGDRAYDPWWTQLVQMLGRGRVQRSSAPVRFEVSHPRVQVEEAVVLTLVLTDAALQDRRLTGVRVEVVSGEEAVQTLTLGETGPKEPGRYELVWRPQRDGDLELRVVEPMLAEWALTQRVTVIRPDDELRQTATDHGQLTTMAQRTGGRVVALEDLPDLRRLLPNRARRTPMDETESIWDSPLALMLVVGLLTVEWVGRKLIRLV